MAIVELCAIKSGSDARGILKIKSRRGGVSGRPKKLVHFSESATYAHDRNQVIIVIISVRKHVESLRAHAHDLGYTSDIHSCLVFQLVANT